MAIPKDLARALDNLRAAICSAEEELAKTPGADGVNVLVEDLSTEDVQAYLQFDTGKVNELYVSFESKDKDELIGVLALDVTSRLKAAAHIPQFIDLAKDRCSMLSPDVEQLAIEITSTLDKYKQVTNGSSESNGSDTRSNRKRATKKA